MSDAFDILLVEDNPADVEFTEYALRKNRIANPLRVVRTGQEALDYLHQRGKYAAVELPGGGAHQLPAHNRRGSRLRRLRQLLHREAGRLREVHRRGVSAVGLLVRAREAVGRRLTGRHRSAGPT